jgi:hypothetical protein
MAWVVKFLGCERCASRPDRAGRVNILYNNTPLLAWRLDSGNTVWVYFDGVQADLDGYREETVNRTVQDARKLYDRIVSVR